LHQQRAASLEERTARHGREFATVGPRGDSDSPVTVLLAVSPAQRVVEVVTGSEASRRISERAARLAVLSVVSSCGLGEVATGVTNGVRILADQAGTLPERSTW
jgi:hypothetical protein